ncbi:decapping and exoribonuclease protein-like [Physella acuta]|uniref:decapping and exoribonuclease protein-like n=1 Tax=Physella acuta TaxID=109671 RepID=UPI0027DD9036|nr:decapping and exoribonuclease protein-like [Physella acuta]
MKRTRDKTYHDKVHNFEHKRPKVVNYLDSFSSMYDRPFPNFREPVEIGSFSQDERKIYKNDKSQLRIFAPPVDPNHCKFDLRQGYAEMIKRDENIKTYINDILHWIVNNRNKFPIPTHSKDKKVQQNLDDQCTADKSSLKRLNIDFICWRGLITRLLCIPYENREDLLVAVIRFRGTHYLCEYDTETKKAREENITPRDEEMCAWGFKFEQYVTADKVGAVPNTSVPVNNNAAFCSMAYSRLETHSLLFGGEVDCEDVNSQGRNKYIELKTSRLIENKRQFENFCKYKLIKWWAQSFVIGIPRIVCGFRDDAGIVRKMKDYSLSEIPRIVNSTLHQPWKPTVCFNFLNAFLNFIKINITEDDESCVYLVRWKPGSPVTIEKKGDDSEFKFLPDWFIHWEAWSTP